MVLTLESLTKVLPPRRRQDILRRQRLVDFLHEHIDLRAQVICAPAGYGKTTLLADFVSDIHIPVCWYSLDASDQDPMIFLNTLLTAIRYRFPDFGLKTEAALKTITDIRKEAPHIVGTLTGEMYNSIPELFILVLEDFHSVESDSITKFILDMLIERGPNNCHFIISSRTPVELPILAKLRVRREVAKLEASEIGFTLPEVRQLMADCYRIELSEVETQKLAAMSEGWITGILLAMSTLLHTRLPNAAARLSSQDLFGYLASEVYEKQPPEVKDFLLLSSTFWGIEPRYCDCLSKLANSEQLLMEIERRNLFISRLEGEGCLYRYHSLFREFLQQKLRREQPSRYLMLHKDAGSIFEGDGQWNQAVEHYLAAGAYAEVVRIIANVGQSFMTAAKWQTVSKWTHALPEKTRLTEPIVPLLEAESLMHLGQVDRAIELLNKLLNEMNATPDSFYVGKALSLRSAAFRLIAHFEKAADDIRKAIRILRRHKERADILADAYRRLGTIYGEQGHLIQAEKYLRRSLKLFLSVFDAGQIAAVHNALGMVCKRKGDLAGANAHYEQARQYWEKAGNMGALALTLNNMAIVYRRQGQYELAAETLNAGLEKARATGYQRAESLLLINLADLKRDLGLHSEALSTYSQALKLARQVIETYQVAVATAGIGDCYRLLGQLDKAEVLLKEALAQARGHGQTYDAGLFSLQLGAALCQQGKYRAAEKLILAVHDQMERLGDKDAVARCAVWLAQVSYLSKKYWQALKWLRKVSQLVNDLGYEEFLVVEGTRILPLLRYGVSRRIGGGLWDRLIHRIREGANLPGKARAVFEQPTTAAETMSDVRAYALGESAVFLNSKPVGDSEWRSSKAREMFFYLLCENKPTRKEQILASLWPDVSHARGSSLFHSNLYRLRRALFDTVVLSKNSRYAVNPEVPINFDVWDFETSLARARKLPPVIQQRVLNLEQAAELYRGPFLKECYTDWAEDMRRQLENKYMEVLFSLATYNYGEGKYGRAIELSEKALAVDPYQEEIYLHLARCYLSSGDLTSALRVCRQYYGVLGKEVGTKSAPEVEKLIHAILSSSK